MSRFLRRIVCFFAAVMVFAACSLTALAEDHTAYLQSLHFDIVLQEDGSAEITETREVSFRGDYEFTRYGFNNRFTGPRVFSDWQVTMDGESCSMLEAPDNEERPENTFAVEDGDGQNTVYIYHRSNNTTRTFQISYRVENAVKLYADVGEFFWNLTAESGIFSISMLTATLTVPHGIPEEEFRIWAHGPLNGTFEKQDASTAYLQVEYVPLGDIVDLRTTIPAEFFTGGWEQEGEALPAILEEEKELADSANAKREEEAQEKAEWEAYWAEREAWEAKHPVLTAIQGVCQEIYDFFYFNVEDQLMGIVGFIAVWVFGITALFGGRWNSSKKLRHKPAQSPQYYRDLPDNRPAPVVDRLIHFYRGDGSPDTSRQISATLLELNLKKLIQFRTSAGDTEIVLNEQRGQELFPLSGLQENAALNPNQTYSMKLYSRGDETIIESQTGVHASSNPTYQETLWRFLQGAADGVGHIGIKELKNYVTQNQETAYDFRCSFQNEVGKEYTKRIEMQSPKGTRFVDSKVLFLVPAVIGILAVLIRMFSTLYDGIEFGASLAVGAVSFAAAMFFAVVYHLGNKLSQKRCYILNQQAENDLALWQAFGRFLDDFTTFERKELPEFPVWREYMVYAVAMGKGKRVAKALSVKYPEFFSGDMGAFDDDYYRCLEDMTFYDALDSIGQEVATSNPPRSASSSDDSSWGDSWSDSWSDSDGGGGGFSDSGGGSDSGSGGDFAD